LSDEPKPRKKFELEAIDIIALAGVALVVGGIAMVSKPGALIVLGALLLFYAFALARPRAPRAPREES
jgi:hypothetical protein